VHAPTAACACFRHAPSAIDWHFTFDLARIEGAGRGGLPLTLHALDTRKKTERTHKLLLGQLELIVFSYRVAFLIFDIRHDDDGLTYFDQMDALAFIRTIAPLYPGFAMPEMTAGPHRFAMPQLLPYLLAEFAVEGTPLPAAPQAVPVGTPLPVKAVYDDRMMAYEPGKMYSFKTEGGVESTWTYTVAPEGKGTRLIIQVEYQPPAGVLAKLRGDPQTRHQAEVDQVQQNLKAILDRNA
jgi:hypothetical protein